jgi:hypothetical protein
VPCRRGTLNASVSGECFAGQAQTPDGLPPTIRIGSEALFTAVSSAPLPGEPRERRASLPGTGSGK